MAYISQITPLGSSTTYDLKAAMLTHTPNNTTTFLRGDNTWSNTLTGNLLLSKDANTEWANAPQLQLTGADSKIAAVKLTNSGTNLDIGWDWTARTGAGLGLRSTSSTDTAGGFYLFARNTTENHELVGTAGGDLTWSGLLKITNNSNTTTIGSQNTTFCHIYNSANIPFIFNNTVETTTGGLGTTSYPWNDMYVNLSDGTSDFTDNTELLTSYASNNGFADTNAKYKVYKRDAICMYNYIKTKASGTWGISITGNAATATYATYPKIVAGNEIRLDVSTKPSSATTLCWTWAWSDGSKDAKINRHNFYNGNGALAEIQGSKVYGAVWNDYAEYRKDNSNEIQEPGRCVRELGNGALALTTKRLERGCEIISDTFGFAIGQDEENGYNTPIASNGRVLAYPYESIEEFANHIGWPVCSGPNGTVSIMTEEEEEKYPSRIIGTISEIPTYEEWGTGNVKVNGRVWIRIR